MMFYQKLLITCFLSLLAQAAIAKEPKNANCVSINITNNTPTACTSSDPTIVHGYLWSTDTTNLIPPDKSTQTVFCSDISYYGPDIILTYTCGNNTATFEIQQDIPYFYETTPIINMLKHQGLTSINSTQPSSLFIPGFLVLGQPGEANIILLSTDSSE